MEGLVTVDVHLSGELLRRFEYTPHVPYGDIKPELQQEFGAGSLSPAGSEHVRRLVSSDQLEPGTRYIYNVFPPAAVVVHTLKGRTQLPSLKLPVVANEVYVKPLEREQDVRFEQVAVKDGSSEEPLHYEKFRSYNIKVEPGQEIFLKAKHAGHHRNLPRQLRKFVALTMYIKLVAQPSKSRAF